MALVATARSVDRYMLKILLTHTGGTGQLEEDAVLTNAQVLAMMVDGPLKDIWSALYATLDAAQLALSEGEHAEIIGPNPVRESARGGAGEGQVWATAIVLTNQLAGLTIFGDGSGHPRIVQLTYRHSTGR